jgi:ketosteroid isomerase-like protein
MSQENVEIVRRGFEAFRAGLARGDPGAMFDSGLLAPDAEWIVAPNTPGLQPVYRGREGFVEFMRVWTEDLEWSIDLERVIDAGNDRVVAVFQQRATGKASGAPVELHMALLYDLENGRVIRMRNFLDPDEALEAAGLTATRRCRAGRGA